MPGSQLIKGKKRHVQWSIRKALLLHGIVTAADVQLIATAVSRSGALFGLFPFLALDALDRLRAVFHRALAGTPDLDRDRQAIRG